MTPFQKSILIYYAGGELPEGITLNHLVVLRGLFWRKGWIEPCNTHPYCRPSRIGLLEFLENHA